MLFGYRLHFHIYFFYFNFYSLEVLFCHKFRFILIKFLKVFNIKKISTSKNETGWFEGQRETGEH